MTGDRPRYETLELRPPETDDDFMPDAEYVRGYDDGFEDARPPVLVPLALGIVLGIVATIVGLAVVR